MIRWTGLAPWEIEFPFPGAQQAPTEDTRALLGADPRETGSNLPTSSLLLPSLELSDAKVYEH